MTTFVQDMPIARKVTVVILLTCMAALIVAGVALFAVQMVTFRRTFVGDLSAATTMIAHNTSLPVTRNDRLRTFEILRALEAKPAVTYASIRLNDGSVFVRYGITPTTEEAEQTSKVKGIDFTGDELVIMQPIFEEGRQIGMLQVRAAYYAELHRLALLYGEILVGVLTAAILLAFLMSARLRRSISDPILQLAETARVVAENNDYSVRAQKLSLNNELGIFTDSFNKMLAQIEMQNLALEASRAELERKVDDRTLQLSSSNRDLQRELEERQRAEEEARQARVEADRANRAKSEFLSRMSHELRTPMNAILGFGQLLEIDFELRETEGAECPRDFAQERHSVDQILKGGAHLLELMNEILDLSAIEAGGLTVSCESVRLDEVVWESIELMEALTRERKITLTSKWDAGEVEFAFADRQRIKQVLLNLLSNAIKYNRDGGSVSISCTRIPVPSGEVDPDVPRRVIRIDIADTGPGISAQDQERLFQPFQRLSAERTGIEGTGLGLALSKRMVELMGGTLILESIIGQGSTFSIELLAADAPEVEDGDFNAEALLLNESAGHARPGSA
jgi:signal transduction histidine kinase